MGHGARVAAQPSRSWPAALSSMFSMSWRTRRPSWRSQIVFGESSSRASTGVHLGQAQGGVNSVFRSVVAEVSNAVHSISSGSVTTSRA